MGNEQETKNEIYLHCNMLWNASCKYQFNLLNHPQMNHSSLLLLEQKKDEFNQIIVTY